MGPHSEKHTLRTPSPPNVRPDNVTNQCGQITFRDMAEKKIYMAGDIYRSQFGTKTIDFDDLK